MNWRVTPAAQPPFPFAEATIEDLQARMKAGALTARQLTDAYLERIARVDKATVNSVIEVNPDARSIADALDAERRAGKVRGPLHGIPVLIKDNIATADGMETTAGSLALVGLKPLLDSKVAARLREAGAIILGKTNLSEWANFRSTKPLSGWSGRGGQTRNPFNLMRDPSGSSSGSAAAVSANLCVVAVGTETDGSIVSPSSICGIVGIKPTVGLVGRSGIIPISSSQDTAGPMARTVRDAAILLAVLSAPDERDPATAARPSDSPADYLPSIAPNALKGARIGVMYGPFGFAPKVNDAYASVVGALKDAGAEVVEPIQIPAVATVGEAEMTVMRYEFKSGINAYLASLGPDCPVKSLGDLIAFNDAHAGREMPVFGQEIFKQAQAKGPLTDKDYLDARAACVRLARTEGIDAAVANHHLDAIVAVTCGPAWLIDEVNGDSPTGGSSKLAAVAGYPGITVPAATIGGLPIGVSFFGPPWTEARLISLAADFEAKTRARRNPGPD